MRGILEKLPKTLDETYERVLEEVNEDNREHARRLLHCIAVAIRPLRVEELAEILAFDFDNSQGGIPKLHASWRWKDQEEAVLLTCSSLIAVVDYHDWQGVSRVVLLCQGILNIGSPCHQRDLSLSITSFLILPIPCLRRPVSDLFSI